MIDPFVIVLFACLIIFCSSCCLFCFIVSQLPSLGVLFGSLFASSHLLSSFRQRFRRGGQQQEYEEVQATEMHSMHGGSGPSTGPGGNPPIVEAEAILVAPLQNGVIVEHNMSNKEYSQEAARFFNANGGNGNAHIATAPIAQYESAAEMYNPMMSSSQIISDSGDPPMDSNTAGSEEVRGCGDMGMFKDVYAAILFLVNFLLVAGLCVHAVIVCMYSLHADDEEGKQVDNGNTHSEGPTSTKEYVNQVIDEGLPSALLAFGCIALFAVTLSGGLYLTVLIRYSNSIISSTVLMSTGFLGLSAVLSLLAGGIIPALIFGLFAGLVYWWWRSNQDRIEFAGAILKTAATTLKANIGGLLYVTIGMLVMQLVYTAIWVVAAIYLHLLFNPELVSSTDSSSSSSTMGHNDHSHSHYSSSREDDYLAHPVRRPSDDDDVDPIYVIIMFFMLISLYWGVQVISNVVSNTVGGTLATWWFTPHALPKAVSGSFFRACTTSFGSICLGSLLVAFLSVLRSLAESAKRSNERRSNNRVTGLVNVCVYGCVACVLRIVEDVMIYFNRYAFIYCAAYGTNFLTGGKRAMHLFSTRGWEAIINDNLISNALGVGRVAVALVTMIFSLLLSPWFADGLEEGGIENPAIWLALSGLILGFVVGGLLSNLIESAVAAVFVYFAEDPVILQENHPGTHDDLIKPWLQIHPTSLAWIIGDIPASNAAGSPVEATAIPSAPPLSL